jgi:hypothetical protein
MCTAKELFFMLQGAMKDMDETLAQISNACPGMPPPCADRLKELCETKENIQLQVFALISTCGPPVKTAYGAIQTGPSADLSTSVYQKRQLMTVAEELEKAKPTTLSLMGQCTELLKEIGKFRITVDAQKGKAVVQQRVLDTLTKRAQNSAQLLVAALRFDPQAYRVAQQIYETTAQAEESSGAVGSLVGQLTKASEEAGPMEKHVKNLRFGVFRAQYAMHVVGSTFGCGSTSIEQAAIVILKDPERTSNIARDLCLVTQSLDTLNQICLAGK